MAYAGYFCNYPLIRVILSLNGSYFQLPRKGHLNGCWAGNARVRCLKHSESARRPNVGVIEKQDTVRALTEVARANGNGRLPKRKV